MLKQHCDQAVRAARETASSEKLRNELESHQENISMKYIPLIPRKQTARRF